MLNNSKLQDTQHMCFFESGKEVTVTKGRHENQDVI